MAAIVVTAASVVPGASPGQQTIVTVVAAGASITPGMPVVIDTNGFAVRAANTSDALSGYAAPGRLYMAMSSASALQPLVVSSAGDVTFNAVLTAGVEYYLGAAGEIVPRADVTTALKVTNLGIASSTTNLRFSPKATGIGSA